MRLKRFRKWLIEKNIIILFIIVFIFLSCCIIIIVEGNINNKIKTKDLHDIYVEEVTIMPRSFKTINFTSKGTSLHWSLIFDNSSLDLHIVDNRDVISEDPLNYSSAVYVKKNITKSVGGKISIKNETTYQMLIVNNGGCETNVIVTLDMIITTKKTQDVGQGIVILALISIIGIVLIFCIVYIYKFRVLIYQEKKEYNHILEKIIEIYDVDPNKLLPIIREMNKSANNEGKKLSASLPTISNTIVKLIDNIYQDKIKK